MLHSLEISANTAFEHVCFCFDLSLAEPSSVVADLEKNHFAIMTHIESNSIHNSVIKHIFNSIDNAMNDYVSILGYGDSR